MEELPKRVENAFIENKVTEVLLDVGDDLMGRNTAFITIFMKELQKCLDEEVRLDLLGKETMQFIHDFF